MLTLDRSTKLSFACTPYDRMVPLLLGEITIEGAELRPVPVRPPAEIFRAMIRDGAYDIAEMSLGECFRLAGDSAPFVAVPVFPSRAFRHGFVFVHRNAGIAEPKDLEGKRIGVQHFGMSAAVWIRSVLRDRHGVDFSGVRWVEGPVNAAGTGPKASAADRPAGLLIETESGRSLSDLLADGSIDAMIGAWVPDSFRTSEDVVRLFSDHRGEETRYYAETGIFPIMHALAIRRDLAEAQPALARRVYDACVQSKELAMSRHRVTGALSTMLPWLHDELDEIDRVFGPDFWTYGLNANRKTLDAFAAALVDDGALSAIPDLETVFAPFG